MERSSNQTFSKLKYSITKKLLFSNWETFLEYNLRQLPLGRFQTNNEI